MKKLQIMQSLRKGFTLIELLIVIAVLGVLAAVVVSAIDPIDKINAGNDAKVVQDIAVLGNALEAYAVNNNGGYPYTVADLSKIVTNGDLKALPMPPSGYTCTSYNYNPTGGSATAGAASFTLSCTLKAKKTLTTPKRLYESLTGKVCNVADSATSCPVN